MTYKEALAEALLRARTNRIIRYEAAATTSDRIPALARLAAQRWPEMEKDNG